MKKIKTFLAFNHDTRKAFICEAFSKMQMKAANMNMKLEWNESDSFEKAKNEVRCTTGYEIANCSNVSNFKY